MRDVDDLRIVRSSDTASAATSSLAKITSLILGAAAEGIYGVDAGGHITFANPATEKALGWEAIELIGRPMHETLHHSHEDGSHYPRDDCPIHTTLKQGTVNHVATEVFWRKDGTAFPVEYTSTAIWEQGEITGGVITFRDLTELKRSEQLQIFSRFLQELPMGVFVIDGRGVPLYANDASLQLLGKGIDPSTTTDSLAETYDVYVFGTDTLYPTAQLPIVRALAGETVCVDDIEIRKDDGNIALEVWATPVCDPEGAITHAIAVFTDITERKRLEQELASKLEELEHLALEDPLTRLPNRRAFEILTEQQLMAIGRSQMPATLAIFELEGMKETARAYSRELMEQWLVGFGRVLSTLVKRPDFCARLDFDRFALFVFGDEAYADKLIGQAQDAMQAALRAGRWPTQIQILTGRASYSPNEPWTPTEFIQAAARNLA